MPETLLETNPNTAKPVIPENKLNKKAAPKIMENKPTALIIFFIKNNGQMSF